MEAFVKPVVGCRSAQHQVSRDCNLQFNLLEKTHDILYMWCAVNVCLMEYGSCSTFS